MSKIMSLQRLAFNSLETKQVAQLPTSIIREHSNYNVYKTIKLFFHKHRCDKYTYISGTRVYKYVIYNNSDQTVRIVLQCNFNGIPRFHHSNLIKRIDKVYRPVINKKELERGDKFNMNQPKDAKGLIIIRNEEEQKELEDLMK